MSRRVPDTGAASTVRAPADAALSPHYKWMALSNTTLGVLMATITSSIVLIAMPDIFRGIRLDPLDPGNSFYLLWMILGFLVVSSVLVVSLGRLGDIYGRVRMYNLGFVVFTAASLILTVDPLMRGAGRDVAHRLPHRPGRRRRLPHGQFRRHPHRCLPLQPARPGARHQQCRRHQRLLHRAGRRRHPRADRLAADLPDQRPASACSAPSGPISSSGRPASAMSPASTGRATSPSPSASSS